jgi:hypothetical protein
MQTMTRWTMVAAALALAACGDSNDGTGPGPGGPGGPGGGTATFSAQVSGGVQATIGGTASFGSGTDDQGQTLHFIQLVEGGTSPGAMIQFARKGPQGFSAASYTIVDGKNGVGDGDVVAVLTDKEGNQLTAVFAASGGTLNVTSSSGTRMEGTFTFPAIGAAIANPGAALNVTVTGTFTADKALGSLTVTSAQIRRSP